MNTPLLSPSWAARWQNFSAVALRAFHAYAGWLVSISWRRFVLLSVLLVVAMAILHDLPPFTWTVTERIEAKGPRAVVIPQLPPVRVPAPPQPPVAPPVQAPNKAPIRIETPRKPDGSGGVEINISKDGVQITSPKATGPSSAASAASAAQDALDHAQRAAEAATAAAEQGVRIQLPSGALTSQEIKDAVEEAKRQIQESLRGAKADAEQAVRDAEQARKEAQETIEELTREAQGGRRSTRTTRVGVGDFLMQFTLLWVLASAIIKFTYKGRMQAEVKAAQATETAEAESLKRQVLEARMAAMQAQVEPHFLFNTLASIDHLIETDPARASVMQKNLIALLRASMPTMREASGKQGADGTTSNTGVRDLGRELAVIRPYLEILKVRMEERLTTEINIPDGLLSAEFPPMMIQTLVENAIKHGLEPKPEGGHLRVAAEIVHGKLQMTVADTGLGFGKAATAGTGVGLANIRERLQLLFGARATLTVAENQPCGTRVSVTVPYTTVAGAGA
jgi:Histidine kinase